MDSDNPAGLAQLFQAEYGQALDALGRFNLAIFGKTGTGKSTLVNAIFGQDVARTGTGGPVTTGLDYYVHSDGLLGVYDSRGFETGEAGDRILAALQDIIEHSRSRPPSEQIHIAWYTVRWSDRRFEQQQSIFVRRLKDLGLPVIVVFTQVPRTPDGRVHDDAVQFAHYVEQLQLPLAADGHVYLTNALPDTFLGTVVFGLEDLLDATFATIPEAVAGALTAAQQVDRGRKRQAARRIVVASASSAMATGATPIPFSDAAILIPVQVAMIARITAVYGTQIPSNRAASLVGSLFLTTSATTAGRWLVGNLLKVVPGGQPAAMVISGSVAASITTAMGWAWVAVVESGVTDPEQMRQMLAAEFRKRLRLSRREMSAS